MRTSIAKAMSKRESYSDLNSDSVKSSNSESLSGFFTFIMVSLVSLTPLTLSANEIRFAAGGGMVFSEEGGSGRFRLVDDFTDSSDSDGIFLGSRIWSPKTVLKADDDDGFSRELSDVELSFMSESGGIV